MLIRIFARGSSAKWGMGQDARIVEQALRHLRLKEDRNSEWVYEHVDPLMWVPPVSGQTADIHVYIEMPVRLAVPWATYNMVIVNPEWWPAHAWDWAFRELDLFVFKSPAAAALFPEVPVEKQVVLPWRSDEQESYGDWALTEDRCLYVIGGSANKVTAAKDIIRWWRADWPTLEVRCTTTVAAILPVATGSNVEVITV